MQKKPKVLTIILSILGLFALAGMITLFNKHKEVDILEEKINISEVKEYLKENWDSFNIDGSTSMIPLHQALNNLFSENKEEVKHSKTVDSFEKFITGEVDILLGVTYSDDLLTKAKNKGLNILSEEITKEGFIFLVNKDNSVKNLTKEEVIAIYNGKITNWQDVGGNNALIEAYQRNNDSGSQIRMQKFMGSNKLMDKIYVAEGMGELVLSIAGFENAEDTTNAIGYNMYTFTEKQYYNEQVELLSINGVKPSDETIFDESYPLVIYNYLYYNKYNLSVNKFAEYLHLFLISDEGQTLVANAGYVPLNKNIKVNKDIEGQSDSEEYFLYYNEEKHEFYGFEDGMLVTYHSYADFVLNDTKYKDNKNLRNYLDRLFLANVFTSRYILNEEEKFFDINGYWFDAGLDPDDFYNVFYDGLYYLNVLYYFEEDKYVFEIAEDEWINSYAKEGFLDSFPVDLIAREEKVILGSDLKDLYFKSRENIYDNFSDIKYLIFK